MMKRLSDTPIRVLVVDDLHAHREFMVSVLNASGIFVVVGTASNGREAIAAAHRLRPNVIAMNVYLPIVDGYEATRQIMEQCPTPIVLISRQNEVAQRSIAALAAGALAVVAKPCERTTIPTASERDEDCAGFLTTLRLMAGVRVVTRYSARVPITELQRASAGLTLPLDAGRLATAAAPRLLAIAASTGGPAAVQMVLRGLGADFPLPILLVQHIARGFVAALVEWLNTTIPLPVRVAYQGARLLPGRVYLAPDDHHITVCAPGIVSLCPAMADDRYCPSADHLFASAARVYGASAIGVVLTGMGDDGTRGLLALREAGGLTLAQDAASCVVYGMPRAAVVAGAIVRSEPLANIPGTLRGLAGRVSDAAKER